MEFSGTTATTVSPEPNTEGAPDSPQNSAPNSIPRARLHLGRAPPLLTARSRRSRMLTARSTVHETPQPNPHQLKPLLTLRRPSLLDLLLLPRNRASRRKLRTGGATEAATMRMRSISLHIIGEGAVTAAIIGGLAGVRKITSASSLAQDLAIDPSLLKHLPTEAVARSAGQGSDEAAEFISLSDGSAMRPVVAARCAAAGP